MAILFAGDEWEKIKIDPTFFSSCLHSFTPIIHLLMYSQSVRQSMEQSDNQTVAYLIGSRYNNEFQRGCLLFYDRLTAPVMEGFTYCSLSDRFPLRCHW